MVVHGQRAAVCCSCMWGQWRPPWRPAAGIGAHVRSRLVTNRNVSGSGQRLEQSSAGRPGGHYNRTLEKHHPHHYQLQTFQVVAAPTGSGLIGGYRRQRRGDSPFERMLAMIEDDARRPLQAGGHQRGANSQSTPSFLRACGSARPAGEASSVYCNAINPTPPPARRHSCPAPGAGPQCGVT